MPQCWTARVVALVLVSQLRGISSICNNIGSISSSSSGGSSSSRGSSRGIGRGSGSGAVLPPTERQALVDLYLSTGGDYWRTHTGWTSYANASADPCGGSGTAWFGVDCAPASLHIDGTGTLTGGVGTVSRLQTLTVTCVAPSCLLCNCPFLSLQVEFYECPGSALLRCSCLYLSSNNLTGTLPSSISVLTNLKYVGDTRACARSSDDSC